MEAKKCILNSESQPSSKKQPFTFGLNGEGNLASSSTLATQSNLHSFKKFNENGHHIHKFFSNNEKSNSPSMQNQ